MLREVSREQCGGLAFFGYFFSEVESLQVLLKRRGKTSGLSIVPRGRCASVEG